MEAEVHGPTASRSWSRWSGPTPATPLATGVRIALDWANLTSPAAKVTATPAASVTIARWLPIQTPTRAGGTGRRATGDTAAVEGPGGSADDQSDDWPVVRRTSVAATTTTSTAAASAARERFMEVLLGDHRRDDRV